MLLDKIDERHWELIAAWRVPKFIPLSKPVPSQYPQHFLNTLQVYASALLKAEADQYEQFRSDGRYQDWLSKLTERIVTRVLKAVARIEQGYPDTTLGYHGASQLEIVYAVRAILQDLTHPYTGGMVRLPTQDELMAKEPPAMREPQVSEDSGSARSNERAALRDSYRAAFPDVKIADIIWAAELTRREWTRWISGKAKDGLKHDRSFRHGLPIGKKAEEIRRQPRPNKYTS